MRQENQPLVQEDDDMVMAGPQPLEALMVRQPLPFCAGCRELTPRKPPFV
jgi:hypothetical protein